MDSTYEKALYEIDPDFFSEAIACTNGVLTEVDTCMAWGCECGDGWFKPLKKFVRKVKELNAMAKSYNAVFVCEQLKEKYGELRVYYSIKKYDPEKEITDIDRVNILESILFDCLQQAEKECWNVCEICGCDNDIITTKGYIQRICKQCYDRRGK